MYSIFTKKQETQPSPKSIVCQLQHYLKTPHYQLKSTQHVIALSESAQNIALKGTIFDRYPAPGERNCPTQNGTDSFYRSVQYAFMRCFHFVTLF